MFHSFFCNMKCYFKNNLNNIFSINKIYFFIIILFMIVGLIIGFYNGIVIISDLELEDMTDYSFWGVIKDDWSFFSFLFDRILLLVIPFILCFISCHIIFIPLILYLAIARAYFFALNFAILVTHLSIVGLFYIFLVALPCYILYLIVIIPCLSMGLNQCIISRKFGKFFCNFQEYRMKILKLYTFIFLLTIIVILYECLFLFLIFNKYIFSL